MPAVKPIPTEELAKNIEADLAGAWLPNIYRSVLKLRTRAYSFPNIRRSSQTSIQHTLLGVELKIGQHRVLCPDLATARYLQTFARIECSEVAVPYDITKISRFADELESSWHRMLLLVDHSTKGRTDRFRARLRGLLFVNIRKEIIETGAGAKIPEFKKSTKQRTR